MSAMQRSLKRLTRPKTGVSKCQRHLVPASWLLRGGLAAAALGVAGLGQIPTASAVPSYARQTGQPCATCHTAFPELTPYGRQFKLMGYTSGGNRCDDGRAKSDETQVPLSVMNFPAIFTHVNSKNAVPNQVNDSTAMGQSSLFVAGQLYCDVGAFAQITYDGPGGGFGWDNMDFRYAKSGVIAGTSVVYGVTVNNNPSVQDAWNTAPAWSYPYIGSPTAAGPSASNQPMIFGKWGGQVGSMGGYLWIDRSIYVELSAYGDLPARLQTNWAQTAVGNDRFANAAPYWRLAYEKTWDKNSLMFGTFGMFANIQPNLTPLTPDTPTIDLAAGTDPTLDFGFDTQYQWISDMHAVTLKGSYVWERRKNNASVAAGLADNTINELSQINLSGAYVYDRTYSLSAGYFNTWGTNDLTAFGGSPNSNGWTVDLAYLPFSKGGPAAWPWFNARIGLLYTHFDKLDGVDNSIPGAKASNNDSVAIYSWINF